MGLHVADVGALLDLESALGGFALSAEECLRDAESRFRRGLALLRAREEQFRMEIARCQRLLGGDDEPPGVRERLEDLEKRLGRLRSWQSRLDEELHVYRREAGRLERLAAAHTPRARQWLQIHVADLQAYLSLGAGGGAASFGSSGPGGATSRPGGWSERGIQPIQVSELPEPEFLHGRPEFKKVPIEQMGSDLLELDQMMPEILAGRGQDAEFWRRWDEERGLAFADGRQRVFEAFFASGGRIRAERTAGGYNILAGAEEVWLARQLGLHRLPVSVSEKEVSRGSRA